MSAAPARHGGSRVILLGGTSEIGLAIVGTPWAIGCMRGCTYGEPGAEHFIHYTALITTAIGAGVGALVDAGIAGRRLEGEAEQRKHARRQPADACARDAEAS